MLSFKTMDDSTEDIVLKRLRPLIDDTIDKLKQTTFREDPIAGRRYSRATSIMSSAYKRHAQILDRALLERLKDCSRFQVWREEEFKLSHQSLRELQLHDRIERCLEIEVDYGDRERVAQVDIVVYDEDAGTLRSYNVKRGNGYYDGGKRRILQDELLRVNMHLRDYGRKAGLDPQHHQAHIIFFYGVLSLPRPLAIAGDELDAHFGFPVCDALDRVNQYFKFKLHQLIEDY